MKHKKLLTLLLLVLLTGCAVTKWIDDNSKVILETAKKAAKAVAPVPGAGLGADTVVLVITSLVGLAKWYEHKKNTKNVVADVQSSKKRLPVDSQKMLSEGFNLVSSKKTKKLVAKIKKSL